MVLVDQLVAQAEPAVAADGIETRQQEVACGDQFQLATFDFPLLATDFHAARERFAMDAGPIERHAGGRRFVRRANQLTVGHRQTHDVPQTIFVFEHIGERLLHLRAEQEVLRPGLGLAVGTAALRTCAVESSGLLPCFQRAVAAHLAGFQVAIGEVEFPIGVFEVVHQVAHAAFEVVQRLIGANTRDHHAVDRVANAGRVLFERQRTGDAVVLSTAALQQRMRERRFEVRVPDAVEGLGCARTPDGMLLPSYVVLLRIAHCGTFGRDLGDAGREGAQVLLQNGRAERGDGGWRRSEVDRSFPRTRCYRASHRTR